MTPTIMRRVMLAKYLFRHGIEHARRPGPLAGLAVLSLHDAIELFLQAALEHKSVTLASQTFAAYWTALEKAGCKLNRQGEMDRLNRARVTLKHGGVLPDRGEIAGLLGDAEAFFTENCPRVFNVSFDSVSLSSLVRSDNVRNLLQQGETALAEGKFAVSVERAAMAFSAILDGAHEGGDGLIAPGIEPPFNFMLTGFRGSDRDLEKALRQMAIDVSNQITVLAYHLDYDGYRFLRTYGPIITPVYIGGQTVHWGRPKEDVTNVIASRCVAFAIDAALRLESRSANLG